ncbi:hypothetical protein AB6H26_00310 [Providencia hangzhouensis]|uniref:hypothetical protein n=1 Tax=Providencia hangzhouensis TaxID=3031799 RepID=UPI0034DDC248
MTKTESSTPLSVKLIDANKLKENLEALLIALKKAKPASAKGVSSRKLACPPLWVQVLLLTKLVCQRQFNCDSFG